MPIKVDLLDYFPQSPDPNAAQITKTATKVLLDALNQKAAYREECTRLENENARFKQALSKIAVYWQNSDRENANPEYLLSAVTTIAQGALDELPF